MKKALVLLTAIALLFGLCACGSSEDGGKATQNVEVNIPDNGKKAPSEDTITEDIRNELMKKNQYASLSGIETVKSLTDEGSYELTVHITAETKYADWTYEAELSYTEYDQGWMLDDIDWRSETYYVNKIPESELIAGELNTMFSGEVYGIWAEIFPVEAGTVDVTGFKKGEEICFFWTNTVEKKHAQYEVSAYAYWHYECATDSWLLSESEKQGSMGDFAIYCSEMEIEIDSDFTGTWESDGNRIAISNFTANEFDAEVKGETEHYTLTSRSGNTLIFTGSNHNISFQFNANDTVITRSDFKNYFDCIIKVKNDLPELKNA